MMKQALKTRSAKVVAFGLSLLPLGWLAAIGPDGWGANPVELFNRFLGDWALRFLLITLAVSPFARIFRLSALLRYRRMLCLFAFFYACLHLLSYLVFDQFFDWGAIWEDIVKRQFITVGMLAFLALIPLAVTSWTRIRRRMPTQLWLKLHRGIYFITGAVVLHYFMMIKADYLLASLHGAILIILLLLRMRPAPRAMATA